MPAGVGKGSIPAVPASVGSFGYPIEKPPLGKGVVQRSAKFAPGLYQRSL